MNLSRSCRFHASCCSVRTCLMATEGSCATATCIKVQYPIRIKSVFIFECLALEPSLRSEIHQNGNRAEDHQERRIGCPMWIVAPRQMQIHAEKTSDDDEG